MCVCVIPVAMTTLCDSCCHDNLQGINTPKLHVGNLEVGLYQFKLTVTDTVGQTDTATVSVDVLPGRCVIGVWSDLKCDLLFLCAHL